MNPYEIINIFIQSHQLDEKNSNVLGIIFYGSTKYQTNKPSSDIDLLIVTSSPKCYKGVTYIDGIKIEYFEKSFDYLLNQIYDMKNSLDSSLLSIFKNGEVLFSRDYTMEYLTDEILSQNNSLNKRHVASHGVLNEWLEFFDGISIGSTMFPFVYHNLLEFIRKLFHEENGFSKLPIMKVYDLYQDKSYATKFYCAKLPPQEFRNCFLDLITSNNNPPQFQTLLKTISSKEDYSESSPTAYRLNELQYKSTIAETCVSKVIALYQENHPASLHCYYIALEKLRVLYCNINGLNESIHHFGNSYDAEFLSFFQNCIDKIDPNNLRNLFVFISSPLKMDYHHYKILEYHT